MFAQSHNIVISGGTFTQVRGNLVFEKLERACAPNAFHNSSARCDYDRPKCHPNTRVAILEYLMGWIFGRNDPETLILWLYGPAGAGKSAILQTIAEHCFERKILLASFFFARSDPSRNHFKPFVATIACQIAVTIPELKPYIENVVQHDSHIFDKSIATQIQSLVIEPLTHLGASGFFNDLSTCARLILIDALDECDNLHMQSEILRAIAGTLRGHQIPLIFLVSSRPEQSITLTFNSSSLIGLWRSLVLDKSFKPDKDILLFLNDSFREIKASHPLRRLIPEAWPVPSDIDKLVEKSSGQFIFASVVIKYVSAHDDRPPQRLEVIMGLRPARSQLPFAELDEVYKHILASCTDPERVHLILECFISGIDRLTDIEILLELEPGDVEIALTPLHSILIVSPGEHNSHLVDIYSSHAFFGDFLVDSSRSTSFYVNKSTVKEHTLSTCIRKLMHPPLFASNTTLPQQGLFLSNNELLISLGGLLCSSLEGLPLTETVENALKELSLAHMWEVWSPGSNIGRLFPSLCWQRSFVVSTLLGLLNLLGGDEVELGVDFDRVLPASILPWEFHVTQPGESIHFAELYTFHSSSFEPLFKSELMKYYRNRELTSLLILTTSVFCSNKADSITSLQAYGSSSVFESIQQLLQITEESKRFDSDNLDLLSNGNGFFIPAHYHYLFSGTNESGGVDVDGDKYAATALQILNFLCAHLPRPLPYRSRPISSRHRASTQHAFPPSSRTAIHERRTHCRFLRKLRVEKHHYGVVLSLPQTETKHEAGYKIIPSEVGLRALPEVLEKSSKSPELVNFIRTHGKDIAFLPNWTRKAIRAMHEYLDRPDDVLVVIE